MKTNLNNCIMDKNGLRYNIILHVTKISLIR